MDPANGAGAAAERSRSVGAFGKLEKLGPGSTGGDGCVGEDAGHCGIRADWTSGRAARKRFPDEGDLHGCGAPGRRGGERVEGGISGNECAASGVRLYQRARAATARDAGIVRLAEILPDEANGVPDQHFAGAGRG